MQKHAFANLGLSLLSGLLAIKRNINKSMLLYITKTAM